MGSPIFESDENRATRDYEDGQKAGSEATTLDAAFHGALQGFNSEEYNKGWDHGLMNQPDEDD